MILHSISRCARALALVGLVFCARAHAAADAVDAQTVALEEATAAEYNGDVRDLPPVYTPRSYLLLNEFESPLHLKPAASVSAPAQAVGSTNVALAPMPAPSKNFAGLAFNTSISGGTAGGGWPPDTNGDVGPTYYIQSVNNAFGIFDKVTGARTAAFTENQLWSAASGISASNPCKTQNNGDPVVLHDAIHDRWILTNFAFAMNASGDPLSPFYECLAVSKSGDPVSGGWWFYAIRMDAGSVPANTLADYPKFGLWGDGCLYMGANGFDNSTGNYAGAIFASFNTVNMYAGAALTSSVGFLADTSVFGMFPANALGSTAASMPSSITPEYFVYESATAYALNVRKFSKGTNCGAGGLLGTATVVNHGSYGYPAILAGGNYSPNMVAQSGTTNRLDSLGDRIMQKVQYRKVGTAESLWVVHTTCGAAQNADGACATNTTPAQSQWVQINVSGGTISTTPLQQQIYAPDSTKSRWMGSLAVDASGDMALAYSTSSSSAFPSIAYSGRLVNDAANNLPQTETVLTAGAGSQTLKLSGSFVPRWGDYSSMSVDPVDDCTFWYTSEYYDTAAHGSSGTWQTRIGAFKFSSCTSNVASKLVFTQQPSASYASGATITVKVSVENAAGAVVATDTSAITLALQGGTAGATLGGTKTVSAVAGVATFSLSVDKVGTAYKLHATDGSLSVADSSVFNITAGAAKTVTFTTQPAANSNVVAGTTIPLVAHVVDAAGNAVSGQSITLAFGNNVGGSTLSVSANPLTTNSTGDATFNAVSLNKVGSGDTLTATDTTTPAATHALSNAFNIVAAAPSSIVFTTAPSAGQNIAAGAAIPIAAQVKDSFGNAIVSDNVTLAIGTNAGSATLHVTADPVVTNSSGIATFGGVSLNKAGSGYTLKVTESAGAHNVTGNAFNIIAAAPAKLVFTTQPADVAQGGTLNTIAVTEQDSNGNTVVSDSSTNVSFTVSACGGTLIGNATMSGGVATLAGAQVFTQARAGLKITANDASLAFSDLSQAFDVAPGDIFADGFETCAL